MKRAEEHLLREQQYTSVEDVLLNMSAGEVIEAMQSYARQCCEDLRQRCADGLIPIQTNFLTESREMQEQPGSEYGKTLLEGQIIGAMSVGEASYHAILEAEIILP